MGKKWRSSGIVKDDIKSVNGNDVSPRSRIPLLLKKIKFRYIPAVKSNEYYKFLLIDLYKAVSSAVDSPLKVASEQFSKSLREYTTTLSDGILNHIEIESKLSLPQNFSEIFETLMFTTKKIDSDIMVPLTQRGDGIQARHIPIILKYIADEDYKQSNSRGAVKINTIWGFEEPENGLELLKAFDMADEFFDYSQEIQIFITTHSPAFYVSEEKEGVQIVLVKKSSENDGTVPTTNPERKFMDEHMGLMPFVAHYIAEQKEELSKIRRLWNETPLLDIPTIMVEGKTDKRYFEMAINELSKPLKEKIDNDELRISTKEDEAGTTLIRNWVMAWLNSGNNSKLLAVFDKDYAGDKAVSVIKNFNLYNEQHRRPRVKVIQLELSDAIVEIYKNNFIMPFEIEHLFGTEVWNEAIARKLVSPRSFMELVNSYKGDMPRDKTIDDVLNQKIVDKSIRETIVNYSPHPNKKTKFCDMVEKMYQVKQSEGIFNGFKKTITKIEDYFCC